NRNGLRPVAGSAPSVGRPKPRRWWDFQLSQLARFLAIVIGEGEQAMASQVVKFAGLSDRDRKKVSPLPKLAQGDRLELHVRRRGGDDQTVVLPPAAISAMETLLAGLRSGERVAILTEDQELSPTEASAILGISRP